MGTLATHEEDGTNIVGGSSSRYEEDSWRDNDYGDEIETSKDSAPTRRLASPALSNIGTWVHTSRESKEMIVGYGSQKSDQYGAASVDLETMRATIRYLGHEGHITCIRTNEADPSTFMTAAMDGVVRLYDVRAPTPALAIHHADEFINAALDEHVGGQPCASLVNLFPLILRSDHSDSSPSCYYRRHLDRASRSLGRTSQASSLRAQYRKQSSQNPCMGRLHPDIIRRHRVRVR